MNWSAVAAILMGLAVGIGAFGAHGLKGRLDEYSMGVYEKAVLYHFFHALGLGETQMITPLPAELDAKWRADWQQVWKIYLIEAVQHGDVNFVQGFNSGALFAIKPE